MPDLASRAAMQYQPRVLEYPAFADSFAKALAEAEAGAAPSKRDTGVSGKAAALRKVWPSARALPVQQHFFCFLPQSVECPTHCNHSHHLHVLQAAIATEG